MRAAAIYYERTTRDFESALRVLEERTIAHREQALAGPVTSSVVSAAAKEIGDAISTYINLIANCTFYNGVQLKVGLRKGVRPLSRQR